jgi:hypothetical protein
MGKKRVPEFVQDSNRQSDLRAHAYLLKTFFFRYILFHYHLSQLLVTSFFVKHFTLIDPTAERVLCIV